MTTHTLIIGGTRGIGRALVKALAAEHHRISVLGRRLVSEADRQLPGVHHRLVDLSNHEQLFTAIAELIRQRGKIHTLVFFQRYRGDGDDWVGEMETSLTATKDLIERLVDEFDATDGKAIVIVSSIASYFIVQEQPLSYHVAKAGLNQMVRYYAVVLGPRGIRVNGVLPGTVLKEESKEFYLRNEPLRRLYQSISPLGRMGTAEEVAQVIVFLCSPKASIITGQNIVVDGGLSLQGHESLARQLVALDHLQITRETAKETR